MKYTKVDVRAEGGNIEALAALLLQNGIDSVEIRDPADIDFLEDERDSLRWDYISEEALSQLRENPGITFYLEGNKAAAGAKEEVGIAEPVSDIFSILAEAGYEFDREIVDDEDWLHKWKEYFVPVRITERIVVKPSWREFSPGPSDIVISVEPGLAFGTGTHPTTGFCIEMLETAIEGGERVLDIGCGTGILSVAAALLGAAYVLAVDFDPEAVKSTLFNAELNGVPGKIEARQADILSGSPGVFDIVAANLTADIICAAAGAISSSLSEGGLLLASGILAEKGDRLIERLSEFSLELVESSEKDGWLGMKFVRVRSISDKPRNT